MGLESEVIFPGKAGAGKRVNNGKISKNSSIISDYLRKVQYLCGVNARNNTGKKYDSYNFS